VTIIIARAEAGDCGDSDGLEALEEESATQKLLARNSMKTSLEVMLGPRSQIYHATTIPESFYSTPEDKIKLNRTMPLKLEDTSRPNKLRTESKYCSSVGERVFNCSPAHQVLARHSLPESTGTGEVGGEGLPAPSNDRRQREGRKADSGLKLLTSGSLDVPE
jgi:hypothetical protein